MGRLHEPFHGATVTVSAFHIAGDRITPIWAVRHPEKLRPVRLIAEGFALSRAEVERLTVTGKLVSAFPLSGRLAGDFTFTLKR